MNKQVPVKTHLDTLLDNTPKARRRMRRLGARTAREARAIAILMETLEARRIKAEREQAKPSVVKTS